MNDPAQDRTDAHLDDIDGPDWTLGRDGFPIGYDEWNAIRQLTGQPAGEFDEYLADLKAAAPDGLSWNLYFIRAAARRGKVIPLTPEEWAAYEPPF